MLLRHWFLLILLNQLHEKLIYSIHLNFKFVYFDLSKNNIREEFFS